MRSTNLLLTFLCVLFCAVGVAAQTAEQTTYMLGEVKMTSAAGQPYGSTVSLVKRTLKPAENKIVEVVLTLDPKQPAREFTTVFDIKGSKFTVKDEQGSFSGEGELTGKPWEWSGWKYSVNMLGERKGTLKAEDELGAAGLIAKKSFSGPDGQVRVMFTDDLKIISKEMYDILHAGILTK